MEKLELLLFLSLIYFSFERKNSRIIRKLEEYINSIEENFNSTESEKEESKLFLIGFANYERPENQTYLFFTIIFKKFNIKKTLPKEITVTLEINYSRKLRFLDTKDVKCSNISEDDTNIQYLCRVDEIDQNQNVLQLGMINNNILDLYEEEVNLVYSSYANKTMNNIQDQTGDDLKDINILNSAKLEIDYENKTFNITGISEKNIIDKELIFSYDRNGKGDLKNFTCNVVDLKNKTYKFICNPKSTINTTLDGIIGTGKATNQNILINFEKDSNKYIYFNFNNNYYTDKKPSNGLTGGAIAGIVIASVVALVAIAIIALTFRKSPMPPIQESDMDLYKSNSHQNSSNNL